MKGFIIRCKYGVRLPVSPIEFLPTDISDVSIHSEAFIFYHLELSHNVLKEIPKNVSTIELFYYSDKIEIKIGNYIQSKENNSIYIPKTSLIVAINCYYKEYNRDSLEIVFDNISEAVHNLNLKSYDVLLLDIASQTISKELYTNYSLDKLNNYSMYFIKEGKESFKSNKRYKSFWKRNTEEINNSFKVVKIEKVIKRTTNAIFV